MEYTNLGRSGLLVSRICLGTRNFGWHVDEGASHRLLDEAVEAGINFLDCANSYGRRRGEGWTEQIIGRWIALGNGRREKMILSTKCYARMSDWPNDSRLSARHIRDACDASLRRMQTDHIDLFQMHHVDRRTPWEEIWQALELLIQQGKVIYVGSSNFAAWDVVDAQAHARERNLLGLVSEQPRYNLLGRQVEAELIPACIKYGVAVLPWGPLEGGVLSGALSRNREARSASEEAQRDIDAARPQLESFESLCRELDLPPARVALAWLLQREGVAAPIVGCRTAGQLRDACEVTSLVLSPDSLVALDEIFPGPSEAPDCYMAGH